MTMKLNSYTLPAKSQQPQTGLPGPRAEAETTILFGDNIWENEAPVYRGRPHAPILLLTGECQGKKVCLVLDWKMLSVGLLLIGGIRSGKTTIINKMLAQLLPQHERFLRQDTVFIFDPKGDYAAKFFNPNNPHHFLIGDTRKYPHAVRWNIFAELSDDGMDHLGSQATRDYEYEAARQIANELFVGRESQQQPFFDNAAKALFTDGLIHLIRTARKTGDRSLLCNSAMRKFFLSLTPDDWKRILTVENPDFAGEAAYFSGSRGDMGASVQATLNSMVADLFSPGNPFGSGGPEDTFSMRQTVRKGGAVIFLEYDMAMGDVLIPIYRLLVNRAIKTRTSQSSGCRGNLFLFCDELKLLPAAQLDDAINLGRSIAKNDQGHDLGIRLIAGMQNISQIEAVLGSHEKAMALLGGFRNVIALQNGEAETIRWLSDRFGKNYQVILHTPLHSTPIPIQREGNVLENWDIMHLKGGQAACQLLDEKPFIIQFDKD